MHSSFFVLDTVRGMCGQPIATAWENGRKTSKHRNVNSKLHDAVLSIAKKKAKYAELVEDLVEKVANQERRLWILEKECIIDDSIYPEEKTNKTSDEQINEESMLLLMQCTLKKFFNYTKK